MPRVTPAVTPSRRGTEAGFGFFLSPSLRTSCATPSGLRSPSGTGKLPDALKAMIDVQAERIVVVQDQCPRRIYRGRGRTVWMFQVRELEGLTGFSNISFPCFSTKAFALLASIESNQGSCTLSLM